MPQAGICVQLLAVVFIGSIVIGAFLFGLVQYPIWKIRSLYRPDTQKKSQTHFLR